MGPSGNSQPALGTALRELREEKKLSQEMLGQRASVTARVVRDIEKGRGNPTWATVVAILAGMDVSLAELAKRIEGKS